MIRNFTRFFLLFLFVSLAASCEKVDKYTQFSMDYSADFTVPQTVLLGVDFLNLPFLYSPPIETRMNANLEAYNTRMDLIEAIHLQMLTLEIVSPLSANFDFLESVEVFISAPQREEILLASRRDIPLSLRSLELEISSEDLSAYLKSDNITLRTSATLRSNVREEIQVRANSRFLVDAKLLSL